MEWPAHLPLVRGGGVSYRLCFGLGFVDCNPRLRNICIKEILRF